MGTRLLRFAFDTTPAFPCLASEAGIQSEGGGITSTSKRHSTRARLSIGLSSTRRGKLRLQECLQSQAPSRSLNGLKALVCILVPAAFHVLKFKLHISKVSVEAQEASHRHASMRSRRFKLEGLQVLGVC